METRQIIVSFEKQFADEVEKILDDIGLDFQSGISVFLKRVVKENGIAFLLQNTTASTVAWTQIQNADNHVKIDLPITNTKEDVMENNVSLASRRINSEINEEMRDCIWTMFTKNKKLSYSDYQELARKVMENTGMNQGSAYIYFIILSCFMEGKFNTRTMKFSDLTYYVKRILQEYSKMEFALTIKSLENSIPYWSEKIPGRFAEKVQNLVNQYKPILSGMAAEKSIAVEKNTAMYSKSGFEKYLIAAGYSQITPSGNPSTVYDYLKRVDKVCDIEAITWSELPANINRLVQEYNIGGRKEVIGAESHNAVISALKQLHKYMIQN